MRVQGSNAFSMLRLNVIREQNDKSNIILYALTEYSMMSQSLESRTPGLPMWIPAEPGHVHTRIPEHATKHTVVCQHVRARVQSL